MNASCWLKGEQVDEAVHVTPELDHGMLRQRPHERRPEQPEFGLKEPWGKELLDAPLVQPRFGRQREPREREAVPQAQAEPRAMHGAEVAIDDVRLVIERVLPIEGEELLFDGNFGVVFSGDRREQIESAAEFFVKDGAGQVVAALGAPVQKEPAAQVLIRLVDRDVMAGHPCVPDEQRRGRQSAKPAANDMRLHRLTLRLLIWMAS